MIRVTSKYSTDEEIKAGAKFLLGWMVEDMENDKTAFLPASDTIFMKQKTWTSMGGCGSGYTSFVPVPFSKLTHADVAELFMHDSGLFRKFPQEA